MSHSNHRRARTRLSWVAASFLALAMLGFLPTIAEAAGPDEASFGAPSCNPATGGSLAYTVTNNSSATRSYAVIAGPHGHFPFRVAAGQTRSMTLNGIPVGSHTVRVTFGATTVASQANVGFCVTGGADSFQVAPVDCVNGSGAVRYTITNGSTSDRDYFLQAGPHGHFPFRVAPGKTRSMTLVGVPLGAQRVTVSVGGQQVHDAGTFVVNCLGASDTAVIGSPGCSGGAGTLLFTVSSNASNQSYDLIAGNHAHAGFTPGFGNTASLLLSGIPNGTSVARVVTERGDQVGASKTVTFNC